MEIGTLLKETREEKGYTLDDIQIKTKIQKKYLEAIEQEDFDVLPGKFYARAFIREYAEVLELDPDVVLSNYKEEDPIPEEVMNYTRINRTENIMENKGSSILSFIPTAIVALLVVAIIGVAFMYYQKSLSDSEGDTVKSNETDEVVRHSDDGGKEPEPVEDEKDTKEEKEKETEKKPEIKLIEKGTGNSPESTLEVKGLDKKVKVEVKTTEDTYLEVKDDNDKTYFADMFTSESTDNEFDLSNQERIYFNVGNASGVSIKINGQELEFPVDPKKSVHQKIWVNIK